MAPRESSILSLVRESGVLNEQDTVTEEPKKNVSKTHTPDARNYEYKWFNIIAMSLLHIQAVYGAYLAITGHAKWQTLIFGN